MTENKRLEIAAPAMKQRIITRSNVLVLSELNLSGRDWASVVILATTACNGCPGDGRGVFQDEVGPHAMPPLV